MIIALQVLLAILILAGIVILAYSLSTPLKNTRIQRLPIQLVIILILALLLGTFLWLKTKY